MERISGHGPINRFSFSRSRSSFGLAWLSHAPGRVFACFAARYFGISVSYAAEGIQKCEHDHGYEHIRQSSALSVVRELPNIQQSSFPPIFLLPLLYTRTAESRSHHCWLLPLAPILPPRNIGLAQPTPPHCC